MMTACVAVAGSGYWGKNLVRNLHGLGALAAICDTNPDVRQAFAEQYPGCTMHDSFEAVLADDQVKAVAIATPAETHGRLVRQALMAGRDVFVEKPLCLSVEEAAELADLAEARGRILMVGHLLWYHPAVLKLKEMIDSGELGKVQCIHSTRLNLGKIRREENILWSFAPHDISVILGLLGEVPEMVYTQGGNFLSHQIADVTVSCLNFASGVRAHVFVSWLHPYKEQKLVVVGDRQMAVFNDTEPTDKLVVYPHSVEWKGQVPVANKAQGQPVALDTTEPLRSECQHFLDSIASRKAPRTDSREGVRTLNVLRACQRSMEEKQPVTLTSPVAPAKKTWFAHPTAVVDQPCEIGDGTKIWHFGHVQKGARLGRNCILGQNVNIANDVIIGNNVKIQNNVSVYTGTVVEDDVFLGPSCVLTNVTNPRSQVSRHSLYETTILRRGCTIGANSTIVCGIEIGRYALVSAGAVVTKDVPDYALMMGVPARQAGWVSRHGLPLKNPDADGVYTCPESGLRYQQNEAGQMRCLDVDEESPLPEAMRVGKVYYDDLVHGGHLTPPAS